MSKIASKFGVTVAGIKKENDLASDLITVGQELKITINPADEEKIEPKEYMYFTSYIYLKVACTSDEKDHKEECLKNNYFKLFTRRCYCFEMNLVDVPCNGDGTFIKDEYYKKLSIDLGIEKGVFQAVAKVESGDKKSFMRENPKHTWLLYERHKAYNLIKKKYGQKEADKLKNSNPNLFNNLRGGYKGGIKEIKRLNDAKALIGKEIPIMSCSWGKFQVLGEYYEKLYETPDELEEAQNMCELQQFTYFKAFLNQVKGEKIISAMKNKEWDKIALYYNGTAYEENNYDIKMKEAYEKLKK